MSYYDAYTDTKDAGDLQPGDMMKYRLATKEQIKAKVAAMERHAAEKQAWLSNLAANLKNEEAGQ
jgi:hypothetical protein